MDLQKSQTSKISREVPDLQSSRPAKSQKSQTSKVPDPQSPQASVFWEKKKKKNTGSIRANPKPHSSFCSRCFLFPLSLSSKQHQQLARPPNLPADPHGSAAKMV